MDGCIFCKIASGELPAAKVYEDERVLAFEDLNPQMPVHTLVIPKKHYSTIADGIPDDEMGHLFNTAVRVAEAKGLVGPGFRLTVNTGADAQQTVHHIHVHVCGGAPMNSGSPKQSAPQ
ncbi:MAG: histidine triad nucleotide-binding protein [Eggerthellaceae bacterium]|nr:histidine triad nucleotide-binding protein [Eggerthellaceae bacterium]MDR2715387.1 histidine triad nucleotide-binding protein [Coriobacteriaceae bacterium]